MTSDEIKVVIFDATYNGKEWYRCPHCRKPFKYYDTLYSEGFRKIADGVFIHVPCGGKILNMNPVIFVINE